MPNPLPAIDDLPTAAAIVAMWRDAGPRRWFAKDAGFDAMLRERYLPAHFAAAQRTLDAWREDPEGALALVLLLDQVPRNCFRGSAHAFATDPLARMVASHALDADLDERIEPALRIFLVMPFEHSEDLRDQLRAVALCERLGDPGYLHYARLHRDVIARFGRFPHRNAVLGRTTTVEESAFLAAGGFAG